MKRLASIDTIAPETLAAIFRVLASQDEQWSELRLKKGPLALCAVSSSWRTVASRIPELWDRLFINFTDSDEPRKKTTRFSYKKEQHEIQISPDCIAITKLSIARLWIERAGTRPVSLSFKSTLEFPSIEFRNEIDDFYTEFTPRVISLSFDWPREHDLNFLINSPIVYPALEELVVQCPPEDFAWISMGDIETDVEVIFPALKRLYVTAPLGSTANTTLQRVLLTKETWQQLTHLRLERSAGTFTELCETVALCTLLVECHVGCTSSDAPKSTKSKTTLAELQHLVLELSSGPRFATFFDLFQMPNLTTVSLGYTRGIQATALVQPLTKIFALLPSTLTRLALSIPCPAAPLLALLDRATGITDLRVCFDETLFQEFVIQPALRSLWVFLPKDAKKRRIPSPALPALDIVVAALRQSHEAQLDTLILRDLPWMRDSTETMLRQRVDEIRGAVIKGLNSIAYQSGIAEASFPRMMFEVIPNTGILKHQMIVKAP